MRLCYVVGQSARTERGQYYRYVRESGDTARTYVKWVAEKFPERPKKPVIFRLNPWPPQNKAALIKGLQKDLKNHHVFDEPTGYTPLEIAILRSVK